MFTFIAFAGLLVLLWIAFVLGRLLTLLHQQAVDRLKEWTLPNSEYPAFTRLQVENAYTELDQIVKDSWPIERELFDTPAWKTISSGRALTEEARRLMHEVCLAEIKWEQAQREFHFVMEANLRVRQGHWSIAQAKYYYNDVRSSRDFEATQRAAKWATNLQANEARHSEAEYQEYLVHVKPFEEERDNYLKQWKDRLKTTGAAKRAYFPRRDDD